MAAPLNTCTTIEQRGVVLFCGQKNMDSAKDIYKEMLPIWAHYTHGFQVPFLCRLAFVMYLALVETIKINMLAVIVVLKNV
jgi:hypothetical protein